jgi:anaerobic magnesium-protoporphyrin IX monomethyl ester cyclase
VFEYPEFDYAVIGEGEVPLLGLVKALEQGFANHGSLPGVASIKEDGTYIYGGASPIVTEMDLLPHPAWDLFAASHEYILQTSRGCPFSCQFCMNFNGRKIRPKSPATVLDEMEWLVEKHGARSFIFGDEVFTINRKRTVEICNGMIERGLHDKCKWWCVSHVRCIDYDLALLMKKAGCRMLGLGIESGNEARLHEINKGTSVEIILDKVNSLKRAGLPFEGYFILGYPEETNATAKETVEFAVKINPDMPVIGIMVPYPGTKIGDMAAKGEGGYVMQARSWNDYNKQIGNAISFINLSRRELERIQLLGYAKVFLRNLRFLEFAKFAWRYRLLAWNTFLKMTGFKKLDGTTGFGKSYFF